MFLNYQAEIEKAIETAEEVTQGYNFFFSNIETIVIVGGILLLLLVIYTIWSIATISDLKKEMKKIAETKTQENYAIISVLEDILKETKTK